MNKVIKILVVIGILISVTTYAQEDIDHNVVVMKSYSPVIGDANKINTNPELIDTVQFKSKLNYQIHSTPFYYRFDPKPLKPVRIVSEPLEKLYQHYVLVGMGNYWKPAFEYRFGTSRDKKFLAGFNVKHLSQHGKVHLEDIEDQVYSGYSHNEVNVFAHRFFKKSALEVDLNYKRDAFHFYGLKPKADKDTMPDKSDVKQVYSWMNVSARYKSISATPLNYLVAADYNYFETKWDDYNNDFKINLDITRHLGKQFFTLETSYRFYHHVSPNGLFKNHLINLHPYVEAKKNRWNFRLGLNMFVDNNFYYYPDILVSYNVIDYFLVPYIKLSGQVNDNNYRQIALENPFLRSGINVDNSRDYLVLELGLKGNLTERLSYLVSGSYRGIDGAYFFVNDSSNVTENQFLVEYDKIERYDINAEVNWMKSKKIKLSFSGEYHKLMMDKLEKPWHIPEYQLTAGVDYNLMNKIMVDLDVFVKGVRYAKTYSGVAPKRLYSIVKVPETIDVNLGLEYRYTKLLGAFLRINNLLAHKNYLWNYYPTERFNVMLGVTYCF